MNRKRRVTAKFLGRLSPVESIEPAASSSASRNAIIPGCRCSLVFSRRRIVRERCFCFVLCFSWPMRRNPQHNEKSAALSQDPRVVFLLYSSVATPTFSMPFPAPAATPESASLIKKKTDGIASMSPALLACHILFGSYHSEHSEHAQVNVKTCHELPSASASNTVNTSRRGGAAIARDWNHRAKWAVNSHVCDGPASG